MARLPFRRRRSRMDTVKDLAQIYTTLKLSQAGPRAARRAAKGYAGVKAAKAGGHGARRVVGIALAPIAIGALVAFLKRRNQEPPGYQPAPSAESTSQATEAPRFEPDVTATPEAATPAMGKAAAPKSGTTSASPSPEEPADAPGGDGADSS